MDGKTLARIGAVIFAAVAITAAVIEMNRPATRPAEPPPQPLSVGLRNQLDAELARCSGIGEAAGRDPACLTAWAESRRRFLGQVTRSTASPAPETPTLFPEAPAPAEPTRPAAQPESSQTGGR